MREGVARLERLKERLLEVPERLLPLFDPVGQVVASAGQAVVAVVVQRSGVVEGTVF